MADESEIDRPGAERGALLAAIDNEARLWPPTHRVRTVLARLRAKVAPGAPEPAAPPGPGRADALPTAAPCAGVLEAAGVLPVEMAARLGCSRSNVTQVIKRGGGVSVATLTQWAAAVGGEVTITLRVPRAAEASK